MDDMISGVLFTGMLFGLEVVAIFVLVMAAIYGRQLVFVIVCGIVAAVVMAAELLILFFCAALGYAGLPGNATLISVSALSIIILGIYFPVAIKRCKRKQTGAAPEASSAIPQ